MKRILAVAFHMPPMLSPRSVQVHRLLTYWAKTGCEVHVLCAEPESAAWPEWDPELAGIYPDLLQIHRVPSPEVQRRQRFARIFPQKRPRLRGLALRVWTPFEGLPDPQRWWVPRALRVALELAERVDFDGVVSFGNPMSDHLVGLAVKGRTGLPWAAHFSDPWVDNPDKTYSRFAGAINAGLERKVVAGADRVIFVSDETRDLVMGKYPAGWRARARVVSHAFDPGLYPEPGQPDPKVIFRHLGTFYRHRTPEPFFRALRLLDAREDGLLSDCHFEMVGPCYPPPLVEEILTGFDLKGCVAVRAPVPYLESLRLMVEADVLVLMDAPVTDPNLFLPSKLVDYLGAGRPLLGITPLRGPSADLIREGRLWTPGIRRGSQMRSEDTFGNTGRGHSFGSGRRARG